MSSNIDIEAPDQKFRGKKKKKKESQKFNHFTFFILSQIFIEEEIF